VRVGHITIRERPVFAPPCTASAQSGQSFDLDLFSSEILASFILIRWPYTGHIQLLHWYMYLIR